MSKKIFIFLVIFVGLLSLIATSVARAQTSSPNPEPTIIALEQTLEAQSAKISIIEQQQSIQKQWYELEVMKVVIPISAIAVMLAVVGISSPFVITKRIQSQFEKRLNQAIYRADPTYLPIHIPMTGFEAEQERLKWLGFKNLKPYIGLTDAQTSGIIVYPIRSLDDLIPLEDFIQKHKAKESQMAFIVYTQKTIDKATERVGALLNATLANSSVTIATHIYALSRGLKI